MRHWPHASQAIQGEIVVTFEGTTEYGNPFMARQSYLPPEIHWGHQFAKIVLSNALDSYYSVDLGRCVCVCSCCCVCIALCPQHIAMQCSKPLTPTTSCTKQLSRCGATKRAAHAASQSTITTCSRATGRFCCRLCCCCCCLLLLFSSLLLLCWIPHTYTCMLGMPAHDCHGARSCALLTLVFPSCICMHVDTITVCTCTYFDRPMAQISTVPYPLLGENTFVVSDTACVCTVDGVLTLMWRVGDTYANQMVEAHARAYLLRCVDC